MKDADLFDVAIGVGVFALVAFGFGRHDVAAWLALLALGCVAIECVARVMR